MRHVPAFSAPKLSAFEELYARPSPSIYDSKLGAPNLRRCPEEKSSPSNAVSTGQVKSSAVCRRHKQPFRAYPQFYLTIRLREQIERRRRVIGCSLVTLNLEKFIAGSY